MWSQWPWVSSTRRTPSALAQLEQPLVLVGGVDEHGVAGAPAADDEHVVLVRPDDDLVHLDVGVRPSAAWWWLMAQCATASRRPTIGSDAQAETTSRPRPRATPSWPGSNVTKRTGAGIRSAAARWMALGQAHRLLAGEAGGPVEAALVDGHDVEVVPRQADGVLEVEAQDGLVGQAVDRRQRLGQGQRRGAPHRVAVEGVEHDRPLRRRRRRGPAAPTGVEGDGHAVSPAAPTRRPVDAHARTTPATGGRRAPRRRSGGAGRRRRWRSAGRGRAPGRRAGRAGPAGGRATVTTVRSPCGGAAHGGGELGPQGADGRRCGHMCTQAELRRAAQARPRSPP